MFTYVFMTVLIGCLALAGIHLVRAIREWAGHGAAGAGSGRVRPYTPTVEQQGYVSLVGRRQSQRPDRQETVNKRPWGW